MIESDVVGTCSICGGAVVSKSQRGPATCSKCGAEVAKHGPVLQMVNPKSKSSSSTRPIESSSSTSSSSLLTEIIDSVGGVIGNILD